MKALQSKHLMDTNISVYMQQKLYQPYGLRDSQMFVAKSERFGTEITFFFFLVKDHDILSLIACRKTNEKNLFLVACG